MKLPAVVRSGVSRVTTTRALVACTLLFWIWTQVYGLQTWAVQQLSFKPASDNVGETWLGAWITPVTATIVHGSIAHLLLNMFPLAVFGARLEQTLGRVLTLSIYMAAAYASAGLVWVVKPFSHAPLIGASGAVSGVLGAYSILYSQDEVRERAGVSGHFIKSLWLLSAWVLIQVAFTWTLAQNGYAVSAEAHVGGFALGLVLLRPLLYLRYGSYIQDLILPVSDRMADRGTG